MDSSLLTHDNDEYPTDSDSAAAPELRKHTASGKARTPIIVATTILALSATFAVLDALAPSSAQISHRLNLTRSDGGQQCVKAVDGPVCPAQATKCTVLSEMSYLIQFTEGCVIFCLLLTLWCLESPQRHPVQFIADNSKSIILALMTHFLVIAITALLGDVTTPHCSATSLHAGAQPCDWYIVTFLLDDLTGVPLTLLLYVGSAQLCGRVQCLEAISRIGDYEARVDPETGRQPESTAAEKAGRWGMQVVHWMLCALVARGVETAAMVLLLEPLMRVANTLGWWACTESEVVAKQWLNLLAIPLCLDALQFAIQNFVLKKPSESSS